MASNHFVTGLVLRGSQILDDAEGFSIDRSKYLNASTATSCIRKQWFERNLPDQPEQDWGFARRGKQIELYVVDCLLASGADVRYAGHKQKSLVSEKHRISATPDGFLIVADRPSCIGIEIKSIDPRTNVGNLPRPDHVVQLQIGMELARLEGRDFPKPEAGVLLYVDASNYNAMYPYDIQRDPTVLDRYKPRAKKMLDAKDVSRLDREGKRTGECQKYGGCPFAEVCGVALESAPALKAPARKGSDVDVVLRQYLEAKGTIDELSTANKDRAETLKQHAIANGGSVIIGNHKVALQTVAGRKSFDWKKAEAAKADVSAFTKVGARSERLIID